MMQHNPALLNPPTVLGDVEFIYTVLKLARVLFELNLISSFHFRFLFYLCCKLGLSSPKIQRNWVFKAATPATDLQVFLSCYNVHTVYKRIISAQKMG